MKFLFALIFSFSILFNLSSQTITVKDSDTGKPLEFASILSNKPKAFTITNNLGQADISIFKGSEKIEIRILGYRSIHKTYNQLKDSSFVIHLKREAYSLDEFVISASRFEESKNETLHKISSIRAKEISLQNPQTAADLLGSSGEVFIQKSQQGGGSPIIRGFATNRLLYIIDGSRMNTAIFRGGNIQNVISLDPLVIENAEILFGPGSVVYGSDAIGGVMSFSTHKAQFSFNDSILIAGNAITRYSTANNEKTAHFNLKVGSKRWAMISSITNSNYGDLKMGNHGPEEYLKPFYVQRIDSVDRVFSNDNPLIQNPSSYSQTNLMQKIRFKASNKLEFEYAFHLSETSEYSRYDRLIETNKNGIPIFAVWNYGPQKWMMNQLSAKHSAENFIYDELSFRFAIQEFEESRIDRRLNNNRLRTQTEFVTAYSFNTDFVKSIKNNKINYGLEAVKNDVTSEAIALNIKTNEKSVVSARYPISDWYNISAYTNFQHRIKEKIILVAGARINNYGLNADFSNNLSFFQFEQTNISLSSNRLTWNVGAVYIGPEELFISTNISSGFRAPNIDDMGKIFDFSATNIMVPNTELKSENANNFEINVSKNFKKTIKLDISAYYTYLDNAIVRRETQVNGKDSILYNDVMSKTFSLQNAAFAEIMGTNFGIEIKLPHGFSFTSRFNYQKGIEELEDGTTSPSRHAAPWFGLSRLTYTHNDLSFQFYAVYSGEVKHENLNEEEKQKLFIYAKNSDGLPYSPAWQTLNFKAMYQFNPNFTFSGGIENINDLRYRPYSSGIVAPGRNLVFSIRANF